MHTGCRKSSSVAGVIFWKEFLYRVKAINCTLTIGGAKLYNFCMGKLKSRSFQGERIEEPKFFRKIKKLDNLVLKRQNKNINFQGIFQQI